MFRIPNTHNFTSLQIDEKSNLNFFEVYSATLRPSQDPSIIFPRMVYEEMNDQFT